MLTVQKLKQETWEPDERMAKRCFLAHPFPCGWIIP